MYINNECFIIVLEQTFRMWSKLIKKMDLNLIEGINKKLTQAEVEAKQTYDKLELNKDFNKWFEQLDRDKKLEIYQTHELNKIDYDM